MRRAGLLLLAGLIAWIAAPWNLSLPAADSVNGGGVSSKLDLQAQLEKGLKARRPVDFAFIKKVVEMVDAGTLPRSMVTSTFMYARQKPNDRRVQYFEFALRAQAKKQGIVFDVPK